MNVRDTDLEPCPLCGGKAHVDSLKHTSDTFDATIVCMTCGLRLEWSQPIILGVSPSGGRVYVPIGLNPFEAWNRRTHHAEM